VSCRWYEKIKTFNEYLYGSCIEGQIVKPKAVASR